MLDDEGRAEIAKELNVNIKDVRDMEGRLSGVDSSLNATISDDGEEEWQNMLADQGPNPEDIVVGMKDAETRSKWLNDALGSLSDREQKIIRERHLGYETLTLEELGKDLGISKERVRQLEARAMNKLKTSITNIVDKPELLFASR